MRYLRSLRMRHRTFIKRIAGLATFGLGAVASIIGQNIAPVVSPFSDSRARVVLGSLERALVPANPPGRLIRVIEDPSLGDRWLLCRNLDHPGGPGRLLMV